MEKEQVSRTRRSLRERLAARDEPHEPNPTLVAYYQGHPFDRKRAIGVILSSIVNPPKRRSERLPEDPLDLLKIHGDQQAVKRLGRTPSSQADRTFMYESFTTELTRIEEGVDEPDAMDMRIARSMQAALLSGTTRHAIDRAAREYFRVPEPKLPSNTPEHIVFTAPERNK